jgi:hypothetical protein
MNGHPVERDSHGRVTKMNGHPVERDHAGRVIAMRDYPLEELFDEHDRVDVP